jgi:hypothetical protein
MTKPPVKPYVGPWPKPPAKPHVEPWPFAESDRHAWPDGKSQKFAENLELAQLEVRRKRTDAEIARRKAETDAALERAKAQAQADLDFEVAALKTVIEVAKGGIDRARASADFVEKAAAAIGLVYTTILGVAFSAAERPFPARGLIPAFFLALAVVCSAYFLAWLGDPDEELEADDVPSDQSRASIKAKITNDFILLMRRSVQRRKWLRASVAFLAMGVAFLAAPYVTLGDPPAASNIEWPSAQQAEPQAPDALRAIVYQAQVNEAATREKEPITGDLDWIWWVAAGVGLLVILALSQFPRGEAAEKRRISPYWLVILRKHGAEAALDVLRRENLLTEEEVREKRARLPRSK